jgi:hypothetical protein
MAGSGESGRGVWWRRPAFMLAAGVALGAVISAVVAGLLGPGTPAQPVSGVGGEFETLTVLVEQVTDPAERARLEVERLRLLNEDSRQDSDLRVRLFTGLVPFAAAGVAAVIAWRQLRETVKTDQDERALNRSAQLAERFTRAVEQLGKAGDEHVDLRLGGIYAL